MFDWLFKKKKEKNMLKGIEIHMSEPICLCATANISWGMRSEAGSLSMTISCGTCKTRLQVPFQQLKGSIIFERGYPNQYKNPGPEAKVLSLVPPKPEQH